MSKDKGGKEPGKDPQKSEEKRDGKWTDLSRTEKSETGKGDNVAGKPADKPSSHGTNSGGPRKTDDD